MNAQIAKAEFYGILTDLDSLGVRMTALRRGRSTALVSRIYAAKKCIDRGDLVMLEQAYKTKKTSKTFYTYAKQMIKTQMRESASKGRPEVLLYSPIVPVANELIRTMNDCMAILEEWMALIQKVESGKA